MDRVDAVVVGAGVIGLACARALALRGLETLVLEATGGIGNGTSSRNSEVIHAGLYDAPASLKARLCVAGREQLYRVLRVARRRRTGAAASSSSRRRRRRPSRCATIARRARRPTASTACAG